MKYKFKKQYSLAIGISFSIIAASCGNNNDRNTETTGTTDEIVKRETMDIREIESTGISDAFNIEDIPVSNADIGADR